MRSAMRSTIAALLLGFTQSALFADPPARLGLPGASDGRETERPGSAPALLPPAVLPPAATDLSSGDPSVPDVPTVPLGRLGTPSTEAPPPSAPLIIAPPPGPPGPASAGATYTRDLVPPTIVTVDAPDPFSGQPYGGYPLSYPVAPGYVMPTSGGRMVPIPTSGPGMPMRGPATGPMPMPVGPMSTPKGSTPMGPMPSAVGSDSVYGTGPCSSGGCSPYADGPCRQFSERPFLENLSFFFGFDGAHEPLDLGINSRFGYRFHINWGMPLVEDWNLGLHLGAGYNYGENTTQLMSLLGGPHADEQYFFTAGVFQRNKRGFNWEFAWDYRMDSYYEHMRVGQWRALVSYNLNQCNEVGVWGAIRDRTDHADVGVPLFIRAMSQANLFWKHTWDNQIVTGLSVGIAEDHGRLLAFGPAVSPVHQPVIIGADVFVPLSERLALWGEALFVTPNDSGTVTATFGFAWYPAGRPANQPHGTFSPLLPTANNASFPLDVRR